MAAEQFKGESGDTSAPGGKGGASGGCSRQQGEIRSLRWPDGNSNDFGRYEGIAAQDGWQRVLIATERDDDPYRLIILSNNQIDFYDPPGGITGPVKTFKKPHLDDTYTHLLSCHVVGNTVLATGGCQVGSGSKATSICVLYDVASGEVKKLCKFGNEDSFTSGVLIGDNRQAVVAKYGDNDNIFVVDLERGYIASRWKNSSEHYGSQLIRDPHDPNIIFASPFLAPAFTMWDVRQGGKAPVRTIGRSPRGNCMRKPLNCWNRNAIFHGNDEGIYAYDIGTSKLLLKISIDGAYGYLRQWHRYYLRRRVADV